MAGAGAAPQSLSANLLSPEPRDRLAVMTLKGSLGFSGLFRPSSKRLISERTQKPHLVREAGVEPGKADPHYFAMMCHCPVNIDVSSLLAVLSKCGLAKQCEQKLSLIAPKHFQLCLVCQLRQTFELLIACVTHRSENPTGLDYTSTSLSGTTRGASSS